MRITRKSMKFSIAISFIAFFSGCGGGSGGDGGTSDPEVDTVPDSYSFTAVLDAEPNTEITSSAVTITGIDTAAPILVSNGEYSIDGGEFTASGGTVESGQSISLQATSEAAEGSTVSVELSVGGVMETFLIRTRFELRETVQIEAENADLLGASVSLVDGNASNSEAISLPTDESGVQFTTIQASETLNVVYSAVSATVISIDVNGEAMDDVTLAATGSLTSYSSASTIIEIPSDAVVQLRYESGATDSLLDYLELVPSPLQFVRTFGRVDFSRGDGISVSSTGDVFISGGPDDSNIHRITTDGNSSLFAQGFTSANGSDFDSNGNLFVADYRGNAIRRVAPDGIVSTVASNLDGPAGIYVDANDNVIVGMFGANGGGDGAAVLSISPAGEVSTLAQGGGLSDVIGVVGDEEGNIYAGNWSSGEFYRVTNGNVTLLATTGTNINMIDAARGYAYIGGGSRVVRVPLDGDGEVEVFAGGGVGDGHISVAGLAGINAVAFSDDGNELYLLNRDSGEVKVISSER